MNMKFLDILILLVLFIILGLGLYVLWLNIPDEPTKFEEFKFDKSNMDRVYLNSKEIQFYPNMRYRDKRISYGISDFCDLAKKNDIDFAFSIIEDKTILEFYKKNDEVEISVLCSNIVPRPDEEGHFVAGEGGPSEIINNSNFAVIFSGKVSLFRKNECQNPNIAIHEILHALGFDHNNNQKSVMYPLTRCDQEVDQYLIDEIDRLYSVESMPDLAIESVTANKTGRYLNFEVSIINFGLQDSESSNLGIYAGAQLVKEFNLESIGIGTRKILSVQNLVVPRGADVLSFEIKTPESELSKENNFVELRLVRVDG